MYLLLTLTSWNSFESRGFWGLLNVRESFEHESRDGVGES